MSTLSPSIDRSSEARRISIGILTANVTVVAIKLLVGYRANSLAVFGDAIHASLAGPVLVAPC